MKGTEKQIRWAEEIRTQAIAAAGCIVRNAERAEMLRLPVDRYTISVEVAREIENLVITGLMGLDDAGAIINLRHDYTQNAMENLARRESARRRKEA